MSVQTHESFRSLSIITVLLPVVGLILGIVYLSKDKKLDRKLGEYLIILSIVVSVVWGGILVYVAQPHNQSSVQTSNSKPDSGYQHPQPNHVMNAQGEQVK